MLASQDVPRCQTVTASRVIATGFCGMLTTLDTNVQRELNGSNSLDVIKIIKIPRGFSIRSEY
jgi:fluoride ion exporter CrcB/FEX